MKISKSRRFSGGQQRLGGKRDDVVHRMNRQFEAQIKMMKTAEDISARATAYCAARDNRHQGIKHHNAALWISKTGLSAQDAEMSALPTTSPTLTPPALSATG